MCLGIYLLLLRLFRLNNTVFQQDIMSSASGGDSNT